MEGAYYEYTRGVKRRLLLVYIYTTTGQVGNMEMF